MRDMVYDNFDVRIGRPNEAGRYPVEVIASPAGEMQEPAWVELPLETQEFQASIATLAEVVAMRGQGDRLARHLGAAEQSDSGADISGDAGFPDRGRRVGRELRDLLFPHEVWELFRASRERSKASGKGLRIRLRINPPEVSRLPWEYCYDDTFHFFAVGRKTPLVRYINEPFAADGLLAPDPVRVLVALAQPDDLPKLGGAAERQQLEEAVATLKERVELCVLESTTHSVLREQLVAFEPHLFHFIGHGVWTGATGALALEDDAGKTHKVDADQLRVLLGQSSVRVVFLNACETATHGEAEAIMGVAPGLVRAGIPAVIAMQFAVPDSVAIQFSRDLYRSLALGLPLDAAVTEMRIGAYTSGTHQLAWGIPVLFMRAPDGVIWQPVAREQAAPAKAPEKPRLAFEPVTVSIPAGRFLMGEGQEQHELSLGSFEIGKYPVTNAQYARFLQSVKSQPEPRGWFLRKPPKGEAEHPITWVNWADATKYCEWLSQETGRIYRLPTEAEWEKAARGPDGNLFPWGNEWEPDRCNVEEKGTTPVTSPTEPAQPFYEAGVSPYGAADMLGNVEEWTSTLWGSNPLESEFTYRYNAEDGREDPAATGFRIVRGGSFRDGAGTIRATTRRFDSPQSRVGWRGFRVVLDRNR